MGSEAGVMGFTTLLPCLVVVLLLLIAQDCGAVEVGGWEGRTSHRISGTISFSNPNTLVIDDFSYDGLGVTVFLYYYAPGQAVDNRNGRIIPLAAGEGGSRGEFRSRRAYSNERLVVPLPSGTTACNIGTLTVWCEPFRQTFSRVTIPRNVFINNGVGGCELVGGNTDLPTVPPMVFDNCESFAEDTIQVSWTVNEDAVNFQICGCRPLDRNLNQYMAFGLSGDPNMTFMIGADATVAWVDNNEGTPNAVDYFLTQRVQCRPVEGSGEGACPDTMVTRNGRRCTDDVREDSVVGGIRNENQQCVIFTRPLTTDDDACDTDFDPSNQNQYIVWANGGLGETAFIHFQRSGSETPPIHLGREPMDNCANREIMCSSCPPFIGQRMELLESTTLRVHIGPSAAERGYMGITGQVGWGISWYINGSLVPELVVRRGQTYTFIVEGGTDESDLSRYHPFYITDSISGGRLRNTPEERARETVYAGFEDGNPTGVGRFCEVEESSDARASRETCEPIEDYLRILATSEPVCDRGTPGQVVFTPDDTTPDVVYYQCATHLNLGWRIVMSSAPPVMSSAPPVMSSAPPVMSSAPPAFSASLLTLAIFALAVHLFA